MTTVVYEVKKETLITHITRDDKKTICGKKVTDLDWKHREMKKDEACKECWPRFS